MDFETTPEPASNPHDDIQRDTENANKGMKPEIMRRSFLHPDEQKCEFNILQPVKPLPPGPVKSLGGDVPDRDSIS